MVVDMRTIEGTLASRLERQRLRHSEHQDFQGTLEAVRSRLAEIDRSSR